MPFHSQPVVQRLKGQVRIGGSFDLNDDQAAGIRNREEINDLSFIASEAGDLRINVVGPNRQNLTQLTDKVGLQPRFLVSTRQRVPAAESAFLRQLFDNRR